MPLLTAGPITVAAVAARNLHLLATTEALGPLTGRRSRWTRSTAGSRGACASSTRSCCPTSGCSTSSDEPAFDEVKRALGVGTVIYHVVAQPGAGLSGHHATHVGTGLANGHSAAARDFETIRSRARGREALVDELAGAAIAGLPHAQALLARAIAPYDEGVREACELASPDPDAIRKAVLTAVGGRTQWQPARAGGSH